MSMWDICGIIGFINIKRTMMIFRRKNKHYVSAIDQFLEKFNKTHLPSRSQRDQIKKYQRIFKLRDQASGKEKREQDMWNNF